MRSTDVTYERIMLPMNDGVRLSTHITLPDRVGQWPVIFGRMPYPNLLSFWMDEAKFWVEQGYAFVFQECRGTGKSEGDWTPFIHERQDGLDTLQWIIAQSWCNGNMATYGASYSGVVQWAMADQLPPEVKTMFIGFTGIERYRQSYMNGMFRHDIYTVWALGNAGVMPLDPPDDLYRRALAFRPHVKMDMQLFGKQLSWYRDWVTQVSPESELWKSGLWAELSSMPERTTVPVCVTAGWFDHNLDASVTSFGKLPEEISRNSVFVIGPWVHTQATIGDLDYPDHDRFGSRQRLLALRWFDHSLKGLPLEGIDKGQVTVYQIGDHSWRTWSGQMNGSHAIRMYMWRNGNRHIGILSDEPPMEEHSLTYDYDPNNPVPTRGGAALMAYLTGDPRAAPAASVIQEPPGYREDVLTFLSEPLSANLSITGSIKAVLTVCTDVEDTAFTVQVMEVYPDGRAYNIRDGITSLAYRNQTTAPRSYEPGEIVQVEIQLWPITWTIRSGSTIRVDISSSNFPAYHAHPNRKGIWSYQDKVMSARQTLYTGNEHVSWIDIPVME